MLESRMSASTVRASHGLPANCGVSHGLNRCRPCCSARGGTQSLCTIARQARYEVRFCDPAVRC